MLASIIAAVQDVNVHMTDGGLSARDMIVPAGTLIAAVVGVVIGGIINRATLTNLDARRDDRQDARDQDRAEREDRMDARRADRERALEDERQRNADNASKRQAIGAVRLARNYMFDVRIHATVALDMKEKWAMHRGLTSPVRPEDEHRLATWLNRDSWLRYIDGQDVLRNHFLTDDAETEPDKDWFEGIEHLRKFATIAINTLGTEEVRLAREIGDPHGDEEWEVVEQYEPNSLDDREVSALDAEANAEPYARDDSEESDPGTRPEVGDESGESA